MNRILSFAFLFSLLLRGAVPAHGDMPPEEWAKYKYPDDIRGACMVAIVRAQTEEEAKQNPPPAGMNKQRVYVERVLKGVDTTQMFLIPEGTLKPGARGILLQSVAEMEFTIEDTGKESLDSHFPFSVDPVEGASVCPYGVGLPKQANPGNALPDDMGLSPEEARIPLEEIEKIIAKDTPQEIGLNGQVIDALLFPEKFKTLAGSDPKRASYVQFVVAIHDFERDVFALARLLESRDPAVRQAAEGRLVALTGAKVDAPKETDPHSLRAWAEAWAAHALPPKTPEWPPVPEGALRPPHDAFPEPLLKAVHDNDGGAFAKEFAAWLDSGVLRDREISLVVKSNMIATFDEVPRLTLTQGGKEPLMKRMEEIVRLAACLHHLRFVQEQRARLALLGDEKPGTETTRRALFWELRYAFDYYDADDEYEKLNAIHEDWARLLVKEDCLDARNSFMLGKAADAIKAGNKFFDDPALLDYAKKHHDTKAVWIGCLLCVRQQTAGIPIALQGLKSADLDTRYLVADGLCLFPRSEAVAPLLAAIAREKAAAKRSGDDDDKQEHLSAITSLIVALAQTGDKRGLDVLIASAKQPTDDYQELQEIVRGLGRIRDKRALPALAGVAISMEPALKGKKADSENDNDITWSRQVLSDSVEAFDYVSQMPGAPPPDVYQGDRPILGDDEIKQGFLRIYQWQKEHAK